jgi:hypothetical protein
VDLDHEDLLEAAERNAVLDLTNLAVTNRELYRRHHIAVLSEAADLQVHKVGT